MDNETHINTESKNGEGTFSVIGRIARAQPRIVQEIYQDALAAAIRETYLPQKENLPPTVFFEGVKSTLINEYTRLIAVYRERGLIPAGFDEKFFEINLKAWVVFMDNKQLINESLDILSHTKENKGWETYTWKPDPEYLKKLSKYLHDNGETTQKAFFLGNERGKLFDGGEIAEIKKELERLDIEKRAVN